MFEPGKQSAGGGSTAEAIAHSDPVERRASIFRHGRGGEDRKSSVELVGRRREGHHR